MPLDLFHLTATYKTPAFCGSSRKTLIREDLPSPALLLAEAEALFCFCRKRGSLQDSPGWSESYPFPTRAVGSDWENSGCNRLRLHISETATRAPFKFYSTSCLLTTCGRSSEQLVRGAASDHPTPTANEAAAKTLSLHRPGPTTSPLPPVAPGWDALTSPFKPFGQTDPRGCFPEPMCSESVCRRKLF